MRISCIMPSYLGHYENAAQSRPAKLRRAIQSFLDQRWPNSELIVVADGCTETIDIVQEMISDEKQAELDKQEISVQAILLDKQPPFSGSVRNAGIEEATGQIVCYLDNDDLFMPGHLGAIFHGFFQHPGQEAMYRRWVHFNDFIAGPDLQPIHERHTHLRFGGIGTGGFAHEKSLNVRWPDGYGHDWLVVQSLMLTCPHTKHISGPRYLVCHLPNGIDH